MDLIRFFTVAAKKNENVKENDPLENFLAEEWYFV